MRLLISTISLIGFFLIALSTISAFPQATLMLLGLSILNTAYQAFRSYRIYEAYWRKYLMPLPADKLPKDYLKETVDHAEDPHRPGCFVWKPKVTFEAAMERSFANEGMSLASYLWWSCTHGTEYKLNVAYRWINVKLGWGKYGAAPTSEMLYQFVIHTSIACFLDSKTGNLEMFDTRLMAEKSSFRDFKKIELEMDHSKHTIGALKMDDLTVTDLSEISNILQRLVDGKGHIHIHLWANGIRGLEEHWPLAHKAAEVTQWMNNASAPLSAPVFGVEVEVVTSTLWHNATAEGLPAHNDITRFVAKSKSFQMYALCRRKLREVLPKANMYQIEALMAATIMHSADHYYMDVYSDWAKYSKVLNFDYEMQRTALVPPNQYFLNRLLCRQHMDDPVCRCIYEIAHAIDPVFADGYLFIGCAN